MWVRIPLRTLRVDRNARPFDSALPGGGLQVTPSGTLAFPRAAKRVQIANSSVDTGGSWSGGPEWLNGTRLLTGRRTDVREFESHSLRCWCCLPDGSWPLAPAGKRGGTSSGQGPATISCGDAVPPRANVTELALYTIVPPVSVYQE